MIPKRKLGKSGLEVPVICLGGNVFGWTVNEADTFRLLDRAVGIRPHIHRHSGSIFTLGARNKGGESETIIGRWLARSGKRSAVTIATKVGMDMGEGRTGLSAKHIAEGAEESLKRLQTDHIDLYFSHKDDPDTPLEETLRAHEQLVREGKVRAIGASNYSGARLREALGLSPVYTALQPHYNLLERAGYESDLAPVVDDMNWESCRILRLPGFLSGRYGSLTYAEGRARGPMVGKYMNDRGFGVVDALDAVARDYNSTPARVALAWLLAQPNITAPIASATK